MMMADKMMNGWKGIEAVLDKYKVSDKDRAKVLDAYKAICWDWNECNACARAVEECVKEVRASAFAEAIRPSVLMRYQREQWPDEWSVASL